MIQDFIPFALNKKTPLHFVKSIEAELYGSIYFTFTNNKVRAISTDVNVKELKQFCFSQPRTNDDLNNFLISK